VISPIPVTVAQARIARTIKTLTKAREVLQLPTIRREIFDDDEQEVTRVLDIG
jgi:hypothetical protein